MSDKIYKGVKMFTKQFLISTAKDYDLDLGIVKRIYNLCNKNEKEKLFSYF